VVTITAFEWGAIYYEKKLVNQRCTFPTAISAQLHRPVNTARVLSPVRATAVNSNRLQLSRAKRKTRPCRQRRSARLHAWSHNNSLLIDDNARSSQMGSFSYTCNDVPPAHNWFIDQLIRRQTESRVQANWYLMSTTHRSLHSIHSIAHHLPTLTSHGLGCSLPDSSTFIYRQVIPVPSHNADSRMTRGCIICVWIKSKTFPELLRMNDAYVRPRLIWINFL